MLKRHELIFLPDKSEVVDCKGTKIRSQSLYPSREDIVAHAKRVRENIYKSIAMINANSTDIRKVNGGYYIEFAGKKNYKLNSDSLGKSGLELLNVREEDGVEYATVFITEKALQKLEHKIDEYESGTTQSGKPKHCNLVSSIEETSPGSLKSFWTGYGFDVPIEEPLWCEFWLFKGKSSLQPSAKDMMTKFLAICGKNGFATNQSYMDYPEAVVFEACVSYNDICYLLNELPYTVAEVRRCIQPASFYVERSATHSDKAISFLASRLQPPAREDISICILDSGVYPEHELLRPFIPEDGIMVARSNDDPRDTIGHGTEMAGIALFNDIGPLLENSQPITVPCQLESVKVLRSESRDFGLAEDEKLEIYGSDFQSAVSIAEITRPSVKNRVFCSAITGDLHSPENRLGCIDGKPDSWSAAIDSVCSGSQDEDGIRRLFIESAGNTELLQTDSQFKYPDPLFFSFVQSPGQAWNAITVGAYTTKTKTDSTERKVEPVAPHGGVSPYTSISLGWKNNAPIKPEVLFEGGNAIFDPDTSCYMQPSSLNLVTTSNDPRQPFTYMNATSAATAQAARFCAHLYAKLERAHSYDIWPETIRALLIHSASWSKQMKATFLDSLRAKSYNQILRTCGYGIPDFSKAAYCLDNSATIVIQGAIQPYNTDRDRNQGKSTMNAHIHELPWPSELLSSLGEIDVKLKATLSYYIEPSPNYNKTRYQSAFLTFDVNRPTETREELIDRISNNIEHDGDKSAPSNEKLWAFGIKQHSQGSVNSDFIETSAANLSLMRYLAVYPHKKGWWATSKSKKENQTMRYSLVVTIETPAQDVQIYNEVVNQISITV